MKRTRSSLLTASLLAAALPQGAQAASITVDGSVCTLAEAITSANNDNAAGNGCVDGSGADTITLQADVTLDADLPQIASAITIEGGGHFISGNNARRVLYIANTGNLTLNATTVKNGTASAGGGIFNSGALSLTNSTVSSSNSEAGNMGGGIYTNNGTVTLNSSTVNNNTASIGAGIVVISSTVTLNNVTISGNMATSQAGGIFAFGADSAIMLNNTTVSQNTANANWGGGGIVVTDNAAVTIRSSLVSGNAAGGIGNEVYSDGIINAASQNVFGHSGETSAQAFLSFTPGASDVNATSDGGTPTALSSILNTSLADNGGPTQTHALVAGSPAIDLDAACSAGLNTDQRGYLRPAVSGTGCDTGAYEFGASPAPTGPNDIDDDLILDLADNCMETYNPDQTDTDGDGMGDACDNCPQAANHDQKDSDRNGKGDVCSQSTGGSDSPPSGIRLAPVYELLLKQRQ